MGFNSGFKGLKMFIESGNTVHGRTNADTSKALNLYFSKFFSPLNPFSKKKILRFTIIRNTQTICFSWDYVGVGITGTKVKKSAKDGSIRITKYCDAFA